MRGICLIKMDAQIVGERFKVSKSLIFFPAITFFLYMGISIYILMTGHLHEDAYILYIFSESFANGNGISYFQGGDPVEGATDFLWMIILGVGNLLGSDVAVFAAALNGFGLSVIAFISMLLASRNIRGGWLLFFGASVSLIVLFSQISQASLAGFSTGFYCSFVALSFYLLYQRKDSTLHYVPVVGIVLGLLRPDGVIIGVVASLIGLYFACSKGIVKKYLIYSLICFGIGVVYFVWRYSYFGQLLPLPLYVKSTAPESLPGLLPHVNWAMRNGFLGLFAISTLIFCKDRWRILVSSLPVAILFIALVFATQSQNVSYRFQAPGTTLLIVWSSLLMSEVASRLKAFGKSRVVALGMVGVIALSATASYARDSLSIVRYLQNEDYINYFPYHISKSIDNETTIALTEAGRFAYWVEGKKHDLVGLNTPKVAINGSSPSYIEGLNPDIIFMHVAGTANYSRFCYSNYCELSPEEALSGITVNTDWSLVKNGVRRAPLTIYDHLASNPGEYIIFSVLYGPSYNHLYLVSKSGNVGIDNFEDALKLSFTDAGVLSYWEMKKELGFSSVFE